MFGCVLLLLPAVSILHSHWCEHVLCTIRLLLMRVKLPHRPHLPAEPLSPIPREAGARWCCQLKGAEGSKLTLSPPAQISARLALTSIGQLSVAVQGQQIPKVQHLSSEQKSTAQAGLAERKSLALMRAQTLVQGFGSPQRTKNECLTWTKIGIKIERCKM